MLVALTLELVEAKVRHVRPGVGCNATSYGGGYRSVEGDGKVEGTIADETTSPVTALLTQRRRLRTLT